MNPRRLLETIVVAASLTCGTAASAASGDRASTTLVTPPTMHTLGFRRATALELGLLLPGVKLDDPGGLAVARLAATDDPLTRADDDELTIVALDTGSGTVFASIGSARLASWTGAGDDGPLLRPTDIAIGRDGLVGITDTGNGRIVILLHDGKELTRVGAHGGFVEPRGIATDGAGGFLVCDRGRNAVIRIDAKRGSRTTFGLEAAFDRPVDVATIPEGDRLASGKKRVVVVADRDGARLRVFDPAGAVRATREATSLGFPNAAFDAVELDRHANVFAVDRRGDRIHKMRDDLLPLDTMGNRGTGPGQFLSPRGIAIHRRFGQVFVSEEDGGQYLWIGTDVVRLRAVAGDPVTIDYLLTEDSLVSIRILNSAGSEVAKLASGSRQPAGAQSGTWDGSNSAGRRVAPGEYLVEVRARATYASKDQFECRRTTSVTQTQ